MIAAVWRCSGGLICFTGGWAFVGENCHSSSCGSSSPGCGSARFTRLSSWFSSRLGSSGSEFFFGLFALLGSSLMVRMGLFRASVSQGRCQRGISLGGAAASMASPHGIPWSTMTLQREPFAIPAAESKDTASSSGADVGGTGMPSANWPHDKLRGTQTRPNTLETISRRAAST
jgi:hypothetical protein